tara:strand:+ start:577 stop:933 length:357 start_codon:yes stop_codon:yes gene_type:complete
MTHEFYIKHTTRNTETGLINNIKFELVTTTTNINGDGYTGKYECNTPGSSSDSGFIDYDLLTSSDLLGFINKYGDGSDPTNGLNTYKLINSASYANDLNTPTFINDLPPNVDRTAIII